MSSEHGTSILAGILPAGRERLERASLHLTEEHFTDRQHAALWKLITGYHERYNGIINREQVAALLRGLRFDAGTILAIEETYDALAAAEVDEALFRWSVDQARDGLAERLTKQALIAAQEIITKGRDEGGETLRGHAESRRFLLDRFADIDRDLTRQEAPEGDMRIEGDEMWQDYQRRKTAALDSDALGIRFGIPKLDETVGGLSRGDLGLLVAYTSEGKTSLAVQLAWHAAVMQGRNVVILTTETIREQVRRRMLARHSSSPHLLTPVTPTGINSRDIKNGSLTPEQERVLLDVISDLRDNERYGRLHICQIPSGATIGYCESRLNRLQREFDIDLVIMDSLYLLRAERKRNSNREELSNTLMYAKQLAVTFNDGLGVSFVSPWQVSRAARLAAAQNQCYDPSALSETAEASNSPDLIVSLLAPMDNTSRVCALKMQVMKNRDGERAASIDVTVDYATSRFYTGEQTVNQHALDAQLAVPVPSWAASGGDQIDVAGLVGAP